MITALIIGVLIVVAIVILPGNPKPTMTTAELNKGCTMSLWSLALVALAFAITVAMLIPMMELTP